ncbi:succinate-semialdehyde dehydrogenase, mitochondrial, partial [Olea europaea var. sylvestris]|uniref:succinate-semialdehyde dehydrogenase, mitochondrial n=1 Tax=Olea europaea var. sylvestris TaxID=158386 RepID=UPI000C1CD0AA
TLEGGKPLKEAIGEVSYGASFIEYYAEEAKRVYGDIIPSTLPDRRLFVLKQVSILRGVYVLTNQVDSEGDVRSSVSLGLHPKLPVFINRSRMYFLWETKMPFLDQETSIPKKYRNCPRSFTSNSVAKHFFNLSISAILSHVRMISSTYTIKIIIVPSVDYLSNHALGDCLSPYKDFLSLHTRFSSLDLLKPDVRMFRVVDAICLCFLNIPCNLCFIKVDRHYSEIENHQRTSHQFPTSVQTLLVPQIISLSLCSPSSSPEFKFPSMYGTLEGRVTESVYGISERSRLTALAAADLSIQAGIPPGVVNVVMGNAADIGEALLASSQVRKITFTGSTAVGKKLMAGAAGTVKKVSLELGGNAPCIIFDDADLEVALKGTLATKFRNSGQTCVCANRVLVQEGIYEQFANAFSNAVQNMKVGDGFGEGVVQGPLINDAAVQKVEKLVQDAISKGAKVLVGGKRHGLGRTFYEPTVMAGVKGEMLISREEVFGPVAPLLKFKTEEEAIQLANDTNAGLAAYVFTTNVQCSWRVAEALEYGIVGVNEGLVSTEVAPFGGMKQSGLGREGSKYGIDEFLEIN